MYYKVVFGIFSFLFVIITNEVYGELCDKTKITVRWPNGTKHCLPCVTCRRGWGATYSCGDVINAPLKIPIKCVKCKRRHTYSGGRSSDRCKKCTTCQPNHQIIKKCTRSADTRCGGCKAGYYKFRDPHFSSCEKCSPCCGDANDERIKECARQGLPRNRQCRFRQDRNCSLHFNPRSSQRVPMNKTSMADQAVHPTADQKTKASTVTTKPAAVDQKPTASTGLIKPKLKNDHIININNVNSVGSNSANGWYVFLLLPIIAVAVVFGGVVWYRKREVKETENRHATVEQGSSLTSEEGRSDIDGEQGGQEPGQDDRQSNNDCEEKENELAKEPSRPLKEFMEDADEHFKREYAEFCRQLNTSKHPRKVEHFDSISRAFDIDSDTATELMEYKCGAAQALFDFLVITKSEPVTLEQMARVLDRLTNRDVPAKMLRDADNRLKQKACPKQQEA